MSVDYLTRPFVSVDQVKKAAAECGFETGTKEETVTGEFFITNGKTWIWAYPWSDGQRVDFTQWGRNFFADRVLLEPLAEKLGVEVFSEHTDEFWEIIEGEEPEFREAQADEPKCRFCKEPAMVGETICETCNDTVE